MRTLTSKQMLFFMGNKLKTKRFWLIFFGVSISFELVSGAVFGLFHNPINNSESHEDFAFLSPKVFDSNGGFLDGTSFQRDVLIDPSTGFPVGENNLGLKSYVASAIRSPIRSVRKYVDGFSDIAMSYGVGGDLVLGGNEDASMSNVKFRQALSWALDRQTFVQTETAGSTPALGVINDMYVADEATGTLYRDTDAGKRVVSDIYGDSTDGFNLTKAKQLITEACTEEAAKTVEGHYATGDKVSLEFVVYDDDWKTAIQNHIDDFTAATVGTPLEGKFEVTMRVTTGNQKEITAGNAELCMGILAPNKIVEEGEILYGDKDLLQISEEEYCKIRGSKISMTTLLKSRVCKKWSLVISSVAAIRNSRSSKLF